MKHSAQSRMNYRQIKKRAVSLALLICLIVVSLLSGVFALTNANHVHDYNAIDGACTTCVQIQHAENFLKQLGTTVISSFVVFAGLHAAEIIRAVCYNTTAHTLVTSKIRMNN